MTPNEKAEELINKFIQTNGNAFFAKQCALIAVDEIIDFAHLMDGGFSFEKEIEYWKQVKQEIEKL